jgi:hypothetical protein
MVLNFFFKDISVFKDVKLNFSITFPKGLWEYKKIKENEFCFLKKRTNSAITMSIFDDIKYDYDSIEKDINFIKTRLGNYEAYVKCKLFVEISELQYEWHIIDNNKKVVFYYSILEKISDKEKDSQYNDVLNILNTLTKIS